MCAVLFLLASAGLANANPSLPTIPTNQFNILDYGAYGDGVSNNTAAIQNTITAASAARRRHGRNTGEWHVEHIPERPAHAGQ